MGTDSLVNRVNGQIIDQDFFNLLNRVFQGDFVGRDGTGAATAAQNLGTLTIPWGIARINTLILNGLAIDPSLITALPNRVVSGAIRATSNFPDFIRPAGSGNGASFTLLGNTTNLVLDIDGVESSVTTDIVKAALTVAPAANNTCLINDLALTGQDPSKDQGEDNTSIPVDAMGSELTSRVGTYVSLLNQTSGEILYCLIESTTKLSNARRGFALNNLGTPIPRDVLNNNEVLQLLSTGFIFVDADGVTIDVSYRNPAVSQSTPSSPQTGDYWDNTGLRKWQRYSGAAFVSSTKTFVGYVFLDTADAIGARCEYFSKSYLEKNSLVLELEDGNNVISKTEDFIISVDGEDRIFDFTKTRWTMPTDLESGVADAVSTQYYLYITEDGGTKISDKKPYDERGFLGGRYHPFESWRSAGSAYNNSAGDFELTLNREFFKGPETITYRLNTDVTNDDNPLGASGGEWEIADNTENEAQLGNTGVTESNGIFSLTSNGHWSARFYMYSFADGAADNVIMSIFSTDDDSTYSIIAEHGISPSAGGLGSEAIEATIEVKDITLDKFKTGFAVGTATTKALGDSTKNETHIVFTKLADL